MDGLDEFGVHGDIGVEKLGDGAAFLGFVRQLVELGLIGTRNLGADFEINGRNSEATLELLEADGRCRVYRLSLQACTVELGGERHGEASCVCRADEFL